MIFCQTTNEGETRKLDVSRITLVFGWQQAVLAAVCGVLLLLVAQLPFHASFTVGKEQGMGNDLPFLGGFKASESQGTPDRWRWSNAQFTIDVPGAGQRGVVVTFRVVSHRAQWEPETAPTLLTFRSESGTSVEIPLRLNAATYHIYLPPEALVGGSLRLHGATATWQNPQDRREDMGVALGGDMRVESVRTGGLVLPDRALVVAWPLALALLWSMLRVVGFGGTGALLMLLPLAVVVPLLALTSAPRLGIGNRWVIQFSLMSVVVAGLCAWGVPPLLRRVGAVPPARVLRWLLLLVVLSFALKYGGRLYPESMPGDLQLHVNRAIHTLQGRVYIEAQHRGLPFPFPNGPYLLIVPLLVTGLPLRTLLQLWPGVYEAASVLLLYILVARSIGSARVGVLAAATYALTAGGFMNTWFMFHTQVAAQFACVLLLAVLVVCWPHYDTWRSWGAVVVLFVLVFLGHIGLFLNTSLVGILIIPLLWWRSRSPDEQRGTRWLLAAGVAAGVFVLLCYYSAFAGLIMEQMTGVASEGLNQVTGRDPIPRQTTVWVIWEGGLITHFGFFPVILGGAGALLLSDGRLRHSILPPLIWLTFLVSASQAVLPLITLNSITTRWLMFSAWAIAVGAGVGFAWLWRRGLAGRVAAVAMGGFVCWQTLVLYLYAMVFNQPPIEPF